MIVWILAAAAWLIGWVLMPPAESAGVSDSAAARLDSIPLHAIDRIEIERSGQHWAFARDAEGWWQVSPFRHRVNPELLMAVPAVLQSLGVMQVARADDQDLPGRAELGLDPPSARIRLFGESDTGLAEVQIDLGRRTMAGRAWARRQTAGGPPEVLVVDADLHELLEREPPETWRDMRVFPGLSVDATRVDRTVSGETLTLVRDGRRWRIAAPLPTRADSDAVARHVSEIAGVRGEAVLLDEPGDVSAFGLRPPIATIAVEVDGERHVLLVGDRVGGTSQARYGMIEGVPSVIRLGSNDVARLLGDPTGLVDHTGTDVSAADVGRIRIVHDDDEFAIQRSFDAWERVGGGEADSEGVQRLLEVLIDTRAAEVALHDVYPEELEVAVITLLDRDGAPLDTVRILRAPESSAGQDRWAMENGDNVLRVLPEGTVVPIHPAEFGFSGTP
jgi:hypothetical protein